MTTGKPTEESAEETAFRLEVRAWLKDNLPAGWGTPEYESPERLSEESQALGEAWTKQVYDAGYTGFNYPEEFGGIKRPENERRIIQQEMNRCGTPPGPMSQGLLMVAPTILAWGQDWQKKRFIPKILSGEESWCQGFSEPDAGSDLANVRTTAVRDGDEWVVNGQKVWTSNWKYADYGLVVVKTDAEGARHRNLSYFIFDCNAPGFSRRPLKQMTGESEFGEMFFDDMRIPHENLLGELNRGWYVALTSLAAERTGGAGMASMGFAGRRGRGGIDAIIELARKTKRRGKVVWEDPIFRQEIARFAIEGEALRYSAIRAAARAKKGIEGSGNDQSVGKNFSAEMRQRREDMVIRMLGSHSQLVRGSKGAIDDGLWVYLMLRSRGATIEMGTSEINRNIIAERILGLPRV
jgi:alkylation response protein AidB-like acyl-CoA dehydrogenase